MKRERSNGLPHAPLRFLVVGAGVLGSLYAARLAEAGYPVRILARGSRADELEEHGILLVDEARGRATSTRVPVLRDLGPDVDDEVALVLVRRNQLAALLPDLAKTAIPSIVFMTNNAAGPALLAKAVGAERVLLGFPGAGGSRNGGIVHYRTVSRLIQQTTLGQLDGRTSDRLLAIADAMRAAGFAVALEPRMDAWLKTHASVVSPVALAIYAAGGSTHALGRRPRLLRELMLAVRDNLAVLGELGIPVVPGAYRALVALPVGLLVPILAAGLRSEWAELVLARHANAGRDEMAAVEDDLDGLRRRARVPAARRTRLSDLSLTRAEGTARLHPEDQTRMPPSRKNQP